MAPLSSSSPFQLFFFFFFFVSSSCLLLLSPLQLVAAHPSFRSIYAFGDSLTDTGNSLIYQQSIGLDASEAHLPYGITYFGYPTGRLSDGRLVIDFLADKVNAPHFLLPFLGLNGSNPDTSLVNFATGGTTALTVEYLKSTFNLTIIIPYSLERQLERFSALPIAQDEDALSKALIYFGEIGGNDYNGALFNNFSVDSVIEDFVPKVITIVRNTLEALISKGAKRLIVEGGYPIGCPPQYTQLGFFTNATIDKYNCVVEFRELNEVHDRRLKQLVHDLNTKYGPNVQIVFFDQLKAYAEILKHPSRYGFTNTIDPCFDTLSALVESRNLSTVVACPNPSEYISWDGFHYTEAANRALFNLFYTKGFVIPYPNFLTP